MGKEIKKKVTYLCKLNGDPKVKCYNTNCMYSLPQTDTGCSLEYKNILGEPTKSEIVHSIYFQDMSFQEYETHRKYNVKLLQMAATLIRLFDLLQTTSSTPIDLEVFPEISRSPLLRCKSLHWNMEKLSFIFNYEVVFKTSGYKLDDKTLQSMLLLNKKDFSTLKTSVLNFNKGML